jgi:pimeloyl-ACP methyl ester carboxylesterase
VPDAPVPGDPVLADPVPGDPVLADPVRHGAVPDPDLRPVAPTGRATTADGLGIAYYDLGGEGPPLLLAHATGFCGPVLVPLAARLRDAFHCIVFDTRAHGASDPPPDGNFDWHGFASDALAVVDELGLRRPRGFGHSAGGAALLLAEEARPGTFSSLYCYEPVVFPGDEPLSPSLEGNPLAAGALRRRALFGSRGEAYEKSSKAPFDRFDPDVLAAYLDNGFVPAVGGIRLRCRREHEAQIYAHGLAHDAFAKLDTISRPVALACGALTDAVGPDFLAALAGRLEDSTTVVMPGLGHFGPLEDPGTVASSVRLALSEGEGRSVRGSDTPGA